MPQWLSLSRSLSPLAVLYILLPLAPHIFVLPSSLFIIIVDLSPPSRTTHHRSPSTHQAEEERQRAEADERLRKEADERYQEHVMERELERKRQEEKLAAEEKAAAAAKVRWVVRVCVCVCELCLGSMLC